MPVSDDAIQEYTGGYAHLRGKGILANLTAFGRILKRAGVQVSLSQLLDAARSLQFLDLSYRDDFQAALRSNLVSERDEIPAFDRAFEYFWQERILQQELEDSLPDDPPNPRRMNEADTEDGGGFDENGAQFDGSSHETESGDEGFRIPIASPYDALYEKDFGSMALDESRAITQAILQLAPKLATQLSRRRKPSPKGSEVDYYRTLRNSLKHGGEFFELAFREKRIRKTRIVVMCDVSGSMDCYSRFFIQFMYALQNELFGVETFVFSTFLSRITQMIRSKDVGKALEKISLSILGWSGGTQIGRCLHNFNELFAPRLVTSKTLVLILSDGWERGDTELLAHEMRNLKRRCYKVLWLNPLLSDSRPMRTYCKGIQAVLPHLDLLASAQNLRSLVELGITLHSLAI